MPFLPQACQGLTSSPQRGTRTLQLLLPRWPLLCFLHQKLFFSTKKRQKSALEHGNDLATAAYMSRTQVPAPGCPSYPLSVCLCLWQSRSPGLESIGFISATCELLSHAAHTAQSSDSILLCLSYLDLSVVR